MTFLSDLVEGAAVVVFALAVCIGLPLLAVLIIGEALHLVSP